MSTPVLYVVEFLSYIYILYTVFCDFLTCCNAVLHRGRVQCISRVSGCHFVFF